MRLIEFSRHCRLTNEKLSVGSLVVPCAGEAALVLRKAGKAEVINYTPGDASFTIKEKSRISEPQRRALNFVSDVLEHQKGTGEEKVINDSSLKLLKGIVVYPVEYESDFADQRGNVFPSARIMHEGDTARDLEYSALTNLGKTFPYTADAKTERHFELGQGTSSKAMMRQRLCLRVKGASLQGHL